MKPNFVIVDWFTANSMQLRQITDHMNIDEKYTNRARDLKTKLYDDVLKDDVNLNDQDIDIIEERRQVSINMYHKGLFSH